MSGKIPKILISIVAVVILVPFVGGLYAIGPLEFPCTYQQVQGKKTLNRLENEVQNLTVAGNSPTKVTKSTSLDCLDGSLNNPVSVKATFSLSNPASLADLETAILANQQIKKTDQQKYKAVANLGARQDDPRMREMRISNIETTYRGDDGSRYKVSYILQSSIACTSPTPPESKLDDSLCKSEPAFTSFGLDKQPINAVSITLSEIPSQE